MSLHPASPRTHSHMWLVGVLGLAAGLALMLFVPSLKAIATSIMLFAGFHLIGAIVTLASLYAMLGRRWRLPHRHDALDFGWTPAWTLGPLLLALVCLALAVLVQVAAPAWWPLAIVATLLAANAFAGFLLTRSASRPQDTTLPWVHLLDAQQGEVLDGGCGAGRTSIGLARALPGVRIVALDRFDADYIAAGGRSLLARNLALSGLSERVCIQAGDLTAMPFADARFDAAISAHAMDHLGQRKAQGLQEMARVLKPGGRLLLIVWVPGWPMFAVANVLSLALTRPRRWRDLARQAGFEVIEEGRFNGHCSLLLGKPHDLALNSASPTRAHIQRVATPKTMI